MSPPNSERRCGQQCWPSLHPRSGYRQLRASALRATIPLDYSGGGVRTVGGAPSANASAHLFPKPLQRAKDAYFWQRPQFPSSDVLGVGRVRLSEFGFRPATNFPIPWHVASLDMRICQTQDGVHQPELPIGAPRPLLRTRAICTGASTAEVPPSRGANAGSRPRRSAHVPRPARALRRARTRSYRALREGPAVDRSGPPGRRGVATASRPPDLAGCRRGGRVCRLLASGERNPHC